MQSSILRAALGAAVAAAAAHPGRPRRGHRRRLPRHRPPNVGLVRFTLPDGRFRCSGTLISPRVVLTAGHCTEGPPTNVYVSFDDQLRPDPLAPGISPAEKAAREAFYITGTAHPDPGWDGKLSFSKQHDQGVVVLDTPATRKWPAITPAPLLPVGFLDANQGALKNETFTLVGYGVDIGAKKAQIVDQQRMSTTRPAQERPARGRGVPEQLEGLQGGRRLVLRRLGRRRLLESVRPRRRVVRQLASRATRRAATSASTRRTRERS